MFNSTFPYSTISALFHKFKFIMGTDTNFLRVICQCLCYMALWDKYFNCMKQYSHLKLFNFCFYT